MCGPLALGVAQGGLSLIGSIGAVNAQNSASDANRQAALLAANDQYASTTEQYIEQNRSLIQGGFDAVLEGRANESIAYTSALENGVQGASIKAVLRDTRQKASRSAGRTKQEMASLERQTGASLRHVHATAQGRINSVPRTSLGLGDVAGVLAPIVNSQV